MCLYVNIENNHSNFNLNVDFNLEDNILGLLGASGCGKSMTLKIIAGLITPKKGKIILNDKILFDSEKGINLPPQKRKIGFLFQNYALFPNMTVYENITSGIYYMNKNDRKKLCDEYIKKFHLEGLENLYPKNLSGGQCQRVALARALITNPDMLLLDEPFSALDLHLKSTIVKDFLNLIKDYKGTILFVTHDINEAYRICPNIITYEKGFANKIRKREELFNAPTTITEAKLTGCNNISKAYKLDDNLILAEDWGITILFETELPKEFNYIGIRAHNISVNSKNTNNTFKLKIVDIIENPFFYKLLLKSPNYNETSLHLEVEVNKSSKKYNVNDDIYININSNSIFFIK